MHSNTREALHPVLDLPELNVAIFAFMLNFVWEFWQVPFFRGMPTTPHWQGIKTCTVATLGDAVIALVAFWAVAAASRSRAWVLDPGAGEVWGFMAVGLAITIAGEWLFTDVLHRWTYASSMPTLPVLGTGLLPVLQWIVLPPIIVWFVHRQLTWRAVTIIEFARYLKASLNGEERDGAGGRGAAD